MAKKAAKKKTARRARGAVSEAKAFVAKHEQFTPYVYELEGIPHIGYGTNLGDGLEQWEAEALMLARLRMDHSWLASTYGWYEGLEPRRQAVLLEMAYLLGRRGLRQFRRLLDALRRGRWESAAAQIGDSLMAEQIGAERTRSLMDRMAGES